MASSGLERIVRSEDMAVMGITEIVRHLPRIYAEFRKLRFEQVNLEKQRVELEKLAVPTMVMREMPNRRDTFVLKRGQYDQHRRLFARNLAYHRPARPDAGSP